MYQNLKKIILSLYDLWGAFEHRKRGAILLLFMMVTASFLEAFSIGFLLPVMEVIIEGKTDNDFAGRLLSMSSNLTQEKTLIIVLTVFFLLIVMKN